LERAVVRLPAEALAKLAALVPPSVEVGNVFRIPEGLAAYYESEKPRPALVVRVQRSPSGEPTVAHLVYGTSKGVPPRRALPVPAGEASLDKDTDFDFGPRLELSIAELAVRCTPLGHLADGHLADLEEALANSRQPCRRLPK
jgi:mRNA-degrading endonuclease toxin of MazEF toxin-antitoxin module